MSVWDDEDAELLLRAGDGVSTVARLLGMDWERVDDISVRFATGPDRPKLTLDERQRIGEIRRELRGEKPEPKADPKPPKAPPAAARTTRRLGLRSDRGEPRSSAGMGSMLAVPRTAAEIFSAEESARRSAESELMRGMEARIAELEVKLRDALRSRDETRAEMERINALLTKEQELRWAERKDANEKIERLKAELAAAQAECGCNDWRALFETVESERNVARVEIEQLKAELATERRESAINQKAGVGLANQIGAERDEAQREVERLRARAESAEAEVRRLASEVRGLADLAASLRGLAADVRAMEQTYPSACESCGCPTSRTRLLVEQRDKYSKQADDARRALESYQPDWEELTARRAGTWIETKESK